MRHSGRCFPFLRRSNFPSRTRNQADVLDCTLMWLPSISSARSIADEPLVRIPEGWFWMGSESGQDNERPVHRVWVDEFQLTSCAVTNAEYTRFAIATGNPPAPFCENPDFSDPRQPVVAV